MIIYKETYCPDCGVTISLEFDGTEYKGICPICENEIIESAFGDEQRIEERYGR